MAARLLTAVLLLLAACSAPPAEPVWTRVGAAPGTEVHGWDRGFLAAGEDTLAVSADGRTWRESSPAGLRTLVATAAHGPAAYVLGWKSAALVLWRTEDGDTWHRTVLLDAAPEGRPELAVAAGPRGVIVVASDVEHAGITAWHAPDGRAFGPPAPIPPAEDVVPRSFLSVAATPDGFLVEPGLGLGSPSVPVGNTLQPPRLYSSPDGGVWSDIGPGMPDARVEGMAGNGGAVVVVVQPLGEGGQQIWFRRDGTWRQAGVDPGRLGDPGVVPARQRVLDEVRHWGDGFLVVGHASTDDAANGTSHVLTSRDGSGWNRLPDTKGTVRDVAVSGAATLLAGETESWISRAPPAFAAHPPAPREPAPPTSGPPRYAHDVPVYDPWSEPLPAAGGVARCPAKSEVTDRGDAWACTSGGVRYDPCFLDPEGFRVACWSGREARVFTVPEPLEYDDAESAISWRLDLATGDICTTYTGEDVYNGQEPLWMVCEPGTGAKYVWSWLPENEIQTSMDIDGAMTSTAVVASYR